MKQTFLRQLGIKIGHWTEKNDLTGVTAFLIEKGARIGIDIRGSATGSYNTHAYGEHTSSLQTIHSVIFTGGSSFGMESFSGVMQFLYEHNIGNQFASEHIPGITGAVIYDRLIGKTSHPQKIHGYYAAKKASYDEYAMGNIGVGTGATIGKWNKKHYMKGGFGMASLSLRPDITMAAFVVTNPFGDIVNFEKKQFYSDCGNYPYRESFYNMDPHISANTTLVLIATNAPYSRAELSKIANRCHDALARSIFPVHTTVDGDIVFAISTTNQIDKEANKTTISVDQSSFFAEHLLIEAIKASVVNANGIKHFPSYKEILSQ